MISEDENVTVQHGVTDLNELATRVTRAGVAAIPPTELRQFELRGRDGDEVRFTGQLLGFGTSRRDNHNHYPRRFAAKGEKCSACRWLEVYLYRRYADEEVDLAATPPTLAKITPVPTDYVVHTVGATDVPGEHRLSRISFTTSAFEVLELLTVRRPGDEPFVAAQASRALAQAASLDRGIRDAYINRAVV